MSNQKEIFFNATLNWWQTSITAKGLKVLVFLLFLSVYTLILIPRFPLDETIYPISEMGIGLYLVSLSLVLQLIEEFAQKLPYLRGKPYLAKLTLVLFGCVGFIPAILASVSTLVIPVAVFAFLSLEKISAFKGKPDILAKMSSDQISVPCKGLQSQTSDIARIEILETLSGHERLIFCLKNESEVSLILARAFSIEDHLKGVYPGLVVKQAMPEDLR